MPSNLTRLIERAARRARRREIQQRRRFERIARRAASRVSRSARGRRAVRRLRGPITGRLPDPLADAPRARVRTPEGVTRGLARVGPAKRAALIGALLAGDSE